ncbi:acyltransferase [Macrococcus equi]|uniref:acyltransferase n=1 Tax=Macrococcus equi TaxID=3395462 RepID=UPI0039BDD6A8
MNGRESFKKYKLLIKILNNLFKFTPNFILEVLYSLLNNSDTKFSLLFRYLYIKKFAKSVGENVYIGKYSVIKNLSGLEIGDNVSIHSYCYLDAAGGIYIGNNVSIANSTSIISFEHTWSKNEIPIKYNDVEKKEILISDDVWIGTGCRILGGTNIASRSIIAAGAVVNKDTSSNSIYGGVPAKMIKKI